MLEIILNINFYFLLVKIVKIYILLILKWF